MKKNLFIAIAVVIVSQAILTYLLDRRFRLMACGLIYHLCVERCDDILENTLDRNESSRSLATSDRLQALTDCGPPIDDVARQCLQEAERVFNDRIAALAAADATAREMREQCAAECSDELHACDAANTAALTGRGGTATANVNVVGNIKIDCVEGGAPCFKPVSEFCERASGGCEQCWQSLCGQGEWTVETVGNQLPLNTTLVAATNPSKNPRVLAASFPRGNQSVLNVPPNIKLGEGEQLYFGFSSKQKPGGPVEVRLHRSK